VTINSESVAGPIDYEARWQQIVEARREYIDGLYARLGRTTANYWASRAQLFRPSVRRDTTPDFFLNRVLRDVTPDSTVLDVGAGGGRYAIPLTKHAKQVVAVEPSQHMVGALRDEVAETGIQNLEVVESTWQNADVAPADVVICSHVLYPLPDIVPFLEKLAAKTRQYCFLQLNGGQPVWEMHDLWLRFYDEPVRPQPTYIDAFNLLHQMGIYANVEIMPHSRRGLSVGLTFDRAVEQFRERLVLDDSPETTVRLEAALREKLVETPDGWQTPDRNSRVAIVWWSPTN
jgi:SAM-dependent methyltransferase